MRGVLLGEATRPGEWRSRASGVCWPDWERELARCLGLGGGAATQLGLVVGRGGLRGPDGLALWDPCAQLISARHRRPPAVLLRPGRTAPLSRDGRWRRAVSAPYLRECSKICRKGATACAVSGAQRGAARRGREQCVCSPSPTG